MRIEQAIEYLKDIKQRENTPQNVREVSEALKGMKEKCLKADDQREAKRIWCFEQTLRIQNAYLTAFQQMRQGHFYEGWCTLEQCELMLGFLSPHFSINDNKFFLNFINKHVGQYQSLFPYESFFSPEILVKEKKCNICGKTVSVRNPCGHEKGEIYNGEMCIRIVKGFEPLGISLVKSPLQKYSVPFAVDQNTGKKVDQYDYSLIRFLMKRLQSPFHSWDVKWTKRRHPHSKFKYVTRNEKCPCGSGKKYKKCCLNEAGVLMPHCQFIFSVPPPPELQNIEYTY